MVFKLILLSTVVISLISFVGVFTLSMKKKALNELITYLVALAAGGLLGGAFLHLLPESMEILAETGQIFLGFVYLVLGFVLFFAIEYFFNWHTHHHPGKRKHDIEPVAYLVLIGDTLHNFIDGVVIAAAFLAGVPIGIFTTLAIILHELPQELGDFGILIHSGFSRGKALFANFVTALTSIIGGIVGFFLADSISGFIPFVLPFAAGHFIYIAASDLIPEIKHRDSIASFEHFLVFLLGLGLMFALRFVSFG